MIQSFVSGSFFHHKISTPFQIIKLVVSVEKYCALLNWRGVYVIMYNIVP